MSTMQEVGAREMREAKRWLHRNVNQHRRELGLPVEVNMDDLNDGARQIVQAYAELTKKVVAAFAPIAKALFKQAEQNDWTLGR